MKKVLLISSIALVSMLASCRQYTCTYCNGGGYSSTSTVAAGSNSEAYTKCVAAGCDSYIIQY